MKNRLTIVSCHAGLIAALLAATGCTVTVHQGDSPGTVASGQRALMEHQTPDWDHFSAENHQAGRISFSAQPTADELRAFANAGGRVVINARTAAEMEKLDFNEQQLVADLGMEYVHIPTSPANFGHQQAQRFGQTMDRTTGPVLAHCSSGSRVAMIYGLNLIEEQGMDKDDAINTALDLGMKPPSARLIERTLMEVPGRVIAAVDPARIRSSIDTLAGFGTRHTLSDTKSDTRGIGAARHWVKAQFERNVADSGKSGDAVPRVYFDAHTVEPDGRRITEPVEVVNVVCELPGLDPDSRTRLYYVLGHLDSRASEANDATSDAPGANDDASGVALMIELARVLSKEPLESTVVLVATSGEEQGLYGATLHAKAAQAAGLDIRAVLNNDTVGDPTGVLEGQNGRTEIRVFSEGIPASVLELDDEQIPGATRRVRMYGTEADSDSRQLARYIAMVAQLHATPVQPRLVNRPDRFLRGGDHTPFNKLGYPAVRFTEMYENYDRQHQDVRSEGQVAYGDLPGHVDEGYLADVTRLNAAVLVHLANAPSSPPEARVIVAQLTNDTTLRWAPSPESDVAGYEIVWRDTTAPDWQHTKDVGNATEGTIPLSKDNWFFGVRAYDHDGYRSPVSYPLPARE